MITKTCKKILFISIVLIMIFATSSQVIANITNTAKGTSQNFGISLMHSSKTLNSTQSINFGYRISTKNSYRINARGDYATTILCLDKDKKFPRRRRSRRNIHKSRTSNASNIKFSQNKHKQ